MEPNLSEHGLVLSSVFSCPEQLSKSSRLSVGRSVGPSADVCEKVTFRVSKGN